ncbi:hypothetical protein GCM10009530_63520 [Microbispora corallina]|uniref:Uncharacterized protein n=1 Tax=Microbispora corallina TaxID=83302 RepID=A0ABQ4GBQ7_9ACTN|nr:hypothetical protein [Microbispora corallina]GIH44418.1 hypothetical protein Mco01_74180 [Microbispora corallina]
MTVSDVRAGNGRYDRDPEVARRDAEACELRAQGLTYQQIADELGLSSKGQAYEAVQRALRDIVQEPADEVRQLELLRLDELARRARTVMLAKHLVVDKGTVVIWEGAPLIDDAPVLQVIDRLLKIQERRARLLGLDAPQRVSVDAQQIGEDIMTLIAALAGGDDEDDDHELVDEDQGDDGDPDA